MNCFPLCFLCPAVFSVLVRMNPSSPLLPGESLTLACTTETPQGLKKPEIHWLDPRGERMKNSQGTVKMRVKSQDDGMWTCSVANKKQVQISVKVVGELLWMHK